MIRTLMIGAAAALAAGCTPPAPAPAPTSSEPAPAPAAPVQPPPPWVSAGDANSTRVSIDQDGAKLSFTCLAAPKKQIRIDMTAPGFGGKMPAGAKITVSFDGGATFGAPAVASTEAGYQWSATLPADADLVTGFMMGKSVQAEVAWNAGEGINGSNAVGFETTGDVNQFGTDCAQITGLKGG